MLYEISHGIEHFSLQGSCDSCQPFSELQYSA